MAFSEDFLEITLYLQEGLKWSDGKPITAEDIKFTYETMIDPQIPYRNKSQFDFVESCRVENDTEIVFTFSEVYANELDHLAFTVIPKHVFESVSSEEFSTIDFNENPTVVSGPYKLKKWTRGKVLNWKSIQIIA